MRASALKMSESCEQVASLRARGWAQPREVEALTGKFTHIMLLQRFALAIFAAVYAFGRKVGHRRAKVWPTVLTELERAVALIPLIRMDLSRQVSPTLLQTDACDTGSRCGLHFLGPH